MSGRGRDEPLNPPPDISRPKGFPVQTGRIVFGEVYPCTRCAGSKKGAGWVHDGKGYIPCPRCGGTGWIRRGQLSEG